MMHDTPHKLAGKKVRLSDGSDYVIEDWADRVLGKSVWSADGNPAALEYAVRCAVKNFPIDDLTLYGKIGGFGFIRHVSEITDCEIT